MVYCCLLFWPLRDGRPDAWHADGLEAWAPKLAPRILYNFYYIEHASRDGLAEVDELINELCRQVPELSREQVEAQIKAKIDAIGAGYLTDNGAAFLVAADYGVEIAKPTAKAGACIKELHAGARDVSLVARVLSMSPVRQLTRKDGGQFYLRTMSVYDDRDSTAAVKLWDEKAMLPGIDELRPGDHVKIIKAYVKEDLGGSLAIHVGSNSSIEPTGAAEDKTIPKIDEITKDVSEIKEERANLAVSGIMEGDVALMEYTRRSSGEPATALKMRLRGADGSVTRVVIWGKDMSSVPNMIPNSPKVRLLGASARSLDQGLEIHGNESTEIVIEGARNDGALEPITVRILSKPPIMDGGKQAVLAVNDKREMYNIMDTAGVTGPYMEEEVVECMPAQMHGSSVTLDANSYMRKVEGGSGDAGSAIPTLAEMRVELQDIKPDGYYCVECMVLKSPERREVQTRAGEPIWLAEMYVGDATGEMTIKGWRRQSRMFEGCDRGDKIRIAGLNSRQGMEAGGVELVLTPYSKITKI